MMGKNRKGRMMGENLPVIFRGVVAYILLLLYACTVINMTKAVILHGVAEAPGDLEGQPLKDKCGMHFSGIRMG